jgi:hypothetical protein
MTSGYSGTPLATKLGIKPGSVVVASAAPSNYLALLSPAPDGVTFARRVSKATDVVHLFVVRAAQMAERLRAAAAAVRPDAAIWVSWPKKASRVATDITEQTIRDVALPMGLVDVKVCAVDETWSGLKLVRRKALR